MFSPVALLNFFMDNAESYVYMASIGYIIILAGIPFVWAISYFKSLVFPKI